MIYKIYTCTYIIYTYTSKHYNYILISRWLKKSIVRLIQSILYILLWFKLLQYSKNITRKKIKLYIFIYPIYVYIFFADQFGIPIDELMCMKHIRKSSVQTKAQIIAPLGHIYSPSLFFDIRTLHSSMRNVAHRGY